MTFARLIMTCFFVAITFATAQAQTDKIKRRTITLIEHNSEPEEASTETVVNAAVKINPLMILIGDFPVSLEYSPWDWFTMELGVGITFDRIIGPSTKSVSGIEPESKYGNSFIGNVKFFPGEDAFYDGTYYSLQFTRRVYNHEYIFPNQQALTTQTVEQSVSFTYGFQFFVSDHFFIDMYLGIGLGATSGTSAEETTDPAGEPLYYTYEYSNERENLGFEGGILVGGIKVGYWF